MQKVELNQIGCFTTGRVYDFAQEIVYKVVACEVEEDSFGGFYTIDVQFKDASRGMFCAAKLILSDMVRIEDALLHAYDTGGYSVDRVCDWEVER